MNTSRKIKPVLCVGDLVADIFINPLEKMPRPGESMLTRRIRVFPGGNSLNTAVALRRMGDSVTVAGSIGDDSLGTLLIQQLQELGLDTRGIRREQGDTASTFILLVEGEDRRFISALGVAENFTGEHISEDLIPENGIILIGGYLKLSAWDDAILRDFMIHALQKNNKIVLNVCYIRNSNVNPERVLPLLEFVDVFAPNEDEARAITGETELGRQAAVLREAGAGVVVITMGSDGLYAEDKERSVRMGIIPVPVVDPSGCGDCFTAGLIAALARDRDIIEMLRFGSAAGAIGATAIGCTTAIPPYDKVSEFLKEKQIEILIQTKK
jgi:sugar/nucleoside kinase (ribokinase family)